MSRRLARLALAATTLAGFAHAAELPRRPHLGVALAPSDNAPGLTVAGLNPSAPLALAGIETGDRLLAVDDTTLSTVPGFADALLAAGEGATVELRYVRGDQEATTTVGVALLAREEHDGIETLYDAVTTASGTHRVIVTMPQGARDGAPLPTVFYLQGYNCGTIDWPLSPGHPVRQFVVDLTREGFVVVRMEKSGIGDSRGVPCPEQGLDEECAYFLEGLRFLKTYPFVDKEAVFLFGHSMGGIVAPWVAAREPVAGVAVYGSGGKMWLEYMLENIRRQGVLAGGDPAEVEDSIRAMAPLLSALYVDMLPLEEALARHPGLDTPEMRASLGISPGEPEMIAGRSLRFWQEVAAMRQAHGLRDAATAVLAAWGAADFVSDRDEHEWIAATVNHYHPGKGTFSVVPASDHAFFRKESEEEAIRTGMTGEYHDAAAKVTASWIRGVLAAGKAQGGED
jgi:pimeloyl-ACP methyl ester carboxylesterase